MNSKEIIGLLFTVLSGYSICLGCFLLCLKKRDLRRSKKYNLILAASMALAAGVMITVSFVELFSESMKLFEADHQSQPLLLTGLCFFSGSLFAALLDIIVHRIGDHNHKHQDHWPDHDHDDNDKEDGFGYRTFQNDQTTSEEEQKEKELKSMSILTTASVALHNLPEGLAVLVATLGDVGAGAMLAFAVFLHNLPLGFSITLSVFATTQSRFKSFFTNFFIGSAQPVGALLGYYAFKSIFNDQFFAIIYAFVAGLMVYIALKELLPLAHEYDRKKNLVIPFLFLGMILVIVLMVVSNHGHGEDSHTTDDGGP